MKRTRNLLRSPRRQKQRLTLLIERTILEATHALICEAMEVAEDCGTYVDTMIERDDVTYRMARIDEAIRRIEHLDANLGTVLPDRGWSA